MNWSTENTGKKVTVVRDELGITGAGMYAFTPFERLDKNKKAVFKIGMAAASINKRTEQHMTDYPNGMYMVAFLENPPVPPHTRGTQTPKKSHYLKIEKFILDYLDNHGARKVESTARIKGKTEWRYTDDYSIHEAFSEANKKFGGKLHMYNTKDMSKKARELEQKEPYYKGLIYFV